MWVNASGGHIVALGREGISVQLTFSTVLHVPIRETNTFTDFSISSRIFSCATPDCDLVFKACLIWRRGEIAQKSRDTIWRQRIQLLEE
jgi:hypothetical protein